MILLPQSHEWLGLQHHEGGLTAICTFDLVELPFAEHSGISQMLVKVPLGACLGTLAKQRGLTTRERHWHKSMEELSIPGGRTRRRELAWEELGEGQPGFQSSGVQMVHKMLCSTGNCLRKSLEDSGTQALGICHCSGTNTP